MQKTKRPLSFLLAVLMIVSMFAAVPFTASAEDTYTVMWRNYNGDVLETDTVAEGETPTYDGAAPVMGADPLYTYNWSGWSTEVVPATSDATYIAAFDAAANANPTSESLVGLKLCLHWSYGFGGAYIRYYNTSSASFGVTELTAIQGYNNSCQLYLRGAGGGTYVAVLSPLEGLTPTGMEITGGTGTQQDPYTLSLLYSTPYRLPSRAAAVDIGREPEIIVFIASSFLLFRLPLSIV